MEQIKAIVQLARPYNCLIAALTVLFCGWIVDKGLAQPALWWAIATVVLIAAGANTLNDVFDLATDRVNRPRRPLPAGLLTPKTAAIIAIGEMGLGVSASFRLNWAAVGIALASAVALIAYTPFLKPRPVVGNLTVALVSSLTFIFSGFALGSVKPVLFPAIVAFLFHWGRELFKDVQDAPGDASSGYRTLPLVKGIPFSIAIVKGVFILLTFILFLPLLWSGYNAIYYLMVAIGIIPAVMYTIRILQCCANDFTRMERASILLKWLMVYGLLAIGLGTL